MATDKTFSLPQTLVIAAVASCLAGLAGWNINLEIRKADRSEIIGQSYRGALDIRLANMEEDIRYIRQRMDDRERFNFLLPNENDQNGRNRRNGRNGRNGGRQP